MVKALSRRAMAQGEEEIVVPEEGLEQTLQVFVSHRVNDALQLFEHLVFSSLGNREEVFVQDVLWIQPGDRIDNELAIVLEFFHPSVDQDKVVNREGIVDGSIGIPPDGPDRPGLVPEIHLDEILLVAGLLEVGAFDKVGSLCDPVAFSKSLDPLRGASPRAAV